MYLGMYIIVGIGIDTDQRRRQCITAQANISFEVSNHQGAALVIKHPAYREDARSTNDMMQYMLRNYKSWRTFIQINLGIAVDLRDIVFVTGCDLTADWATATFVEKSVEYKVEFKAGDPSISAASGSFWGRWNSSVNVPHRCGPSPVRPPTTDPTRSNIPGPENPISEEPIYNQCIFLRGFRVDERRLRSPRVIKAAAEPEDLDMDRDGTTSSPVLSGDSDSDDEDDYTNEGYFTSRGPKVANHPS